MDNTREHLEAILQMRTVWSASDRKLAEQLAGYRAKLDDLNYRALKAKPTVSTAAGGEKANPVFSAIDRIAKLERQYARRLGLGLTRGKDDRTYSTQVSQQDVRFALWAATRELEGLCGKGAWGFRAYVHGCFIPEDYQDSNRALRALPVSGEPPKYVNWLHIPELNEPCPVTEIPGTWEQWKLGPNELSAWLAQPAQQQALSNRAALEQAWEQDEQDYLALPHVQALSVI